MTVGLLGVKYASKGWQEDEGSGRVRALVRHPYMYTEEDIAFEVYAVLHDIPKASWPKEREKFLSKGHPHLRVSASSSGSSRSSMFPCAARHGRLM
jgi:Family of unknown function (DUF6157)